eukprot:TRINITY_DN8015_c0_g2_i1.p1 TRINITY_DN8015_c0_g2~~TRINITY_DN8015_c0_g2_i1.p1  ORF type:complete len:310 (-),score=36.72 TRINITY_DN8015_c0_g2_i1:37-966(-)
MNDLWKLDTLTFAWSHVTDVEGAQPTQLSDHVAFVVGNNVFICGGYSAQRQISDLNIFDTKKKVWYLPFLNGIAPCSRNYHTGSILNNKLFIFGGYDGNSSAAPLSDLHVLDLQGVELIKKRHDIEMKFDKVCNQLQDILENARTELRAAFQEDIQTQRMHLIAERKAMQEEMQLLQDEVRKERLQVRREKKLMSKVQSFQKTRVRLNIGGIKFETSMSTLTKDPGSMFAAMFSGRHKIQPDEEGYYFIDRDGTHFMYILNYLRDGSLNLPDDSPSSLHKWLLNECEFYSISSFRSAMNTTLNLSLIHI